jgi:hypothetical protein
MLNLFPTWILSHFQTFFLLYTLSFVQECDLQVRHHSFDEAYFPLDDVLGRFETWRSDYGPEQFNQLAGALILEGRFVAAERVRSCFLLAYK